MALNPLLLRQLRRLGLDAESAPPSAQAWAQLLERVSCAYSEAEQARYLLERSQEISSREMSELNNALRASEGRLASLVSLSSDWVWEQDAELRFTYFSDHLRQRLGLDPDELIGTSWMSSSACHAEPDVLSAYREKVEARQPFRDFTFGYRSTDGRQYYMRISGEPVLHQGAFHGYRGVGTDVTQATLAEQKVLQLARYDSLTGLPNRAMFMTELDRALARSRRKLSPFALFFIDLDRFKIINDTLGHAAGDELLKVMATRLRQVLRESDMLARLGGDEFVVLLEGVVEPSVMARVAGRALATLGEPLTLEGSTMQVTGSIGISMYPTDGEDAPSLLKNADAAMYLAKEQGKNNFQFYTAQLAVRSARHFMMETDLRRALEHDELRVHYQPKVNIASGELTGMEALVRWQHPTRGLLEPGEFIGLAEETGLIVPLGKWVMESACKQVRAWRDALYQVPRCAVNLSVRQLRNDNVVDELVAALSAYGLDADALEVEITESVLMSDSKRAEQILQRLHELGIHIAVDDFGTGYSSLAYLKRFPAQSLKIDRAFVHNLPQDRGDAAITQAVIAMGHSLGMEVVAEGVETAEQMAFLRGLGCDVAQGYYVGRPMDAEDMAPRLAAMPRAKRVA